MKRFSEQFNKKSQSVKLSAAEKTELRERLVSYMEYHPLPAELKSVKKKSAFATSPIFTETYRTVSIPFALLFKSSAVAAALVLVVVPFMAEQSVPGDTLYAVKVQFNEELRSTLIFNSYEKVEWETQRVNRRIAEARLLASEGRLTDEVEAEVAQAVRTHTQNAQKEIDILRAEDAEEATIASIEFDSNLEAQATSLKEDSSEDEGNAQVVKVKTSNLIADAVDESRALNEQPNASTTPSYDKLMARVELSTTRMFELRDSLQSVNPQAKEDVTRRIEDIERSIAEAIENIDTQEHQAREILVDVLKRSQKLIVFMTDLEVSDTVDIEELVPVVLTDEEEVVQIQSYKDELLEKQSQIKVLITEADEDISADVVEKVESSLQQLDGLVAEIDLATEYTVIQTLADTALQLADDLLMMLERVEEEQPEDPVVDTDVSVPTSTPTSTPELPAEEVPEPEVSTTTAELVSTTTVDA